MTIVIATQILGRDLPNPGFLLVFVVIAVAFLMMNRSGGLSTGGGRNAVGEGREYQCARCGFQFHPQKAAMDPNGKVQRSYNDRCPKCGWDLDWGKPDAFGNPQH